MRHTAAIVTLVALTATASADEELTPLPSHQVALTFMAHGTQIGSRFESGAGGNLELAAGTGRVQALIEGSLSTATFDGWTHGAYDMTVVGTMGRAAGGARWLARQWSPDRDGAFELYLLATAGAERFWWKDGGTLTRPEFTAGWGFQGRVFRFHDFAFRFEVRVMFTPTSPKAAERVVCRGTCPEPMPESVPAGFLSSIGVSL